LRLCIVAAIVACGIERASAQAPPGIPVAPPAATSAKAPEFTVRSVLFDNKGAEAARARQQPLYVESIVVEGRDPDGPRLPRKPLEQRFAEALLAPPPSSAVGYRGLDTRPCMSLQSTWNNIGNSYAPASGCP
jgi:hypothetical protein